ncbi:MAG: hypothetical protein J0H16_19800, partial [Alicycliphilus denitrificans]|nr:hypothetical protein [Alicycliphilus denitrificans]
GAEVAPQGLKRACKPCQSGLSSGLRRNQATFRSTSGCVGLANGVLQTFPKAGCAISAQLSNFEVAEIARAHGHAPSDPGSKV